MRKFEIDEDILQNMLEAAYVRGFVFCVQSGPAGGAKAVNDYLEKCAYDYADKTISQYFKS